MDPRAFAAQRAARLKGADAALRPFVEQGLNEYRRGEADWSDVIVDAAAQIWLENHQAEAPGRSFARPLARFRTELADTLDKTAEPTDPVDPAQVDRLTHWLSTYTTNHGTATGAFGRGIKYKRWTTMQDDKVRDSHQVLEGQVRPIGGTFTVDGAKLGFPGEPVGPPEAWINCRCVLMPASKEGEAMSADTYTLGPDDVVEIDNPAIIPSDDAFAVTDPTDIAVEPPDEEDLVDDVPQDDEEIITEIPVHGVLAPEGVATGDGREFALDSLSTRDLPVPLLYEYVHSHGGDTSMTSTVGRVDEAWRDEATNMWRWRGAIVLSTQYAQEAIDGMVNGMVRGVSIDGDAAELEIQELDGDEDVLELLLGGGKTVFAKMRVSGLTIVPIPAFQEAYIALGHDFQEDLSPEDQATQEAALQACGCMSQELDLTDVTGDDPRDALAEVMFRDFPAEDRKKAAQEGNAMPDGSFPIENCDDLANAIQSIGRAKNPDTAKAHIKSRASALSCPDVEIPADWAGIVTAASGTTSTFTGYSTTTSTTSTFAPGTHDGPGWITHPIPTERIRRYWVRGKGAAKIRWGVPGDFNRCRTNLAKYVANPDWLAGMCANMHKEALGFWPAQHHGSRVIIAAGSRLASPPARLAPQDAPTVYPSEWFQNPSLDHAAPLRIERDTRRIFGYVATWGTCHVGIEGFCQDVPRSYSDYGYFKKGLIDTDAGEQPVGVISYGFGHASPRDRIAVATAHYDQPAAVRAYVNLGEDEFGIWFAGVLTPWTTDEDIDAMRAIGAVSGDWREIRGQYELIGIPVVNTPGYPVLAASAGRQVSMIGIGALAPESVAEFTYVAPAVDELVQLAVAGVMRQQKLAARASGARAAVRQERLAVARARIERG